MKRIFVLLVVLCLGTFTALTADFHADFDVAGYANVYLQNDDAYAEFHGYGTWFGDVWGVTQGTYLDVDVDVASHSPGFFNFQAWQNLAGYTNNQVVLQAWAGGPEAAAMNLRFDGSMYVVQFERHDSSADLLMAAGPEYGAGFDFGIRDRDSLDYSAKGFVVVFDDPTGDGGNVVLDTNQWHPTAVGSYGWGNPDGFSTPPAPGYYTPTNTVTASGGGILVQGGFGENFFYYEANYTMPDGGMAGTDMGGNPAFYFNDNLFGTWYMYGN